MATASPQPQSRDDEPDRIQPRVALGLLTATAGSFVLAFVLRENDAALAVLSLGLVLATAIATIAMIYELRYKHMYKLNANLSAYRKEVESSVAGYQSEVHNGLMAAQSLVRSLAEDHELARALHLSLAARSEPLREIGVLTLTDHIRRFSSVEQGFAVEGEAMALDAYARCWEKLVKLQKLQKAHGAPPLIARITHSNDVKIWLPDHNPRADRLLDLQERFRLVDGVVIRLLISSELAQPTDEYLKAIRLMEGRKIEVRFLHYDNEFEFDFLWVDGMNLVAKWYSGQRGRMLASCRITEAASDIDTVRNNWQSLANASIRVNGPFETLPPNLET